MERSQKYGGYSNLKQGAARHDLSRRRTLMRKSQLLSHYCLYGVVISMAGYGVYFVNKKINPPEYATKAHQELAESTKFGVSDVLKRMRGVLSALRENNTNKHQ